MAFEDLLTQIQDEAERGQLAALAAKYPNLKTLAEVGEKFTPIVQQLSQREGVNADAEIAALPKWIDWRANNWDPTANATKQQLAERERAEALQTRVQELEAKGQTEMTYEEIAAKLESEGKILKKDDIVTKAELLADRNAQARHFQQIYAKLTPKAIEYREKFGQDLPYDAVFEYMEKNPKFDPATKQFVMPEPEEAYKVIVSPKERELEVAKLKQEAADAETRGIEKGRQAAMQSVEGRGVPVASGGGQRANTSFMQKIFGKRAERQGTGATGRLGDGTAAREMLAEHQRAAMSGGQV